MNPEQALVAREFARLLVAEIGAESVRRVNEANRTLPQGACASHDHCDANMPMAAAFEAIVGRPVDPDSDDDAALWSQAWEIAQEHGFFL